MSSAMNRTRVVRALACLVASLVLAACHSPVRPPAGTTDATNSASDSPEAMASSGRSGVGATTPRLAVYDLGALDIIQALGGQAAIVPDARLPAYLEPQARAAAARGGSLFEPDEALLRSEQPDRVILGRRAADHKAALSAIAPTVNLAPRPDHFLADVRANVRQLGRWLAADDRAEALISRLDHGLQQVHTLTAGQTGLVLFVTAGGASVQAPGSRHGMLYEVSGLSPVVGAILAGSDEGARPEPGSPQAQALRQARAAELARAMATEPDWLIVLDRTGATGGEASGMAVLAGMAEVAGSAAWRAGRVIQVDAATWYLATGGIQGLLRSLDGMTRTLRQDD